MLRYFFDSDTNLIILSNMAEGAWEPAWRIHDLIMAETHGASEDPH